MAPDWPGRLHRICKEITLSSEAGNIVDLSETGLSTSAKVAELEASREELGKIKQRFALGHAVDFNDFPYVPKTRPLERAAGGEKLLSMFEGRVEEFLH